MGTFRNIQSISFLVYILQLWIGSSLVRALTSTTESTFPASHLFGNAATVPKKASFSSGQYYRSSLTQEHYGLAARARRYYREDDGGGAAEERDDGGRQQQRSVDRPTRTMLDEFGPPISPSKPKIVVLGATGRIGRLVVRQLLEMKSLDMTVVALVRDYDKAISVLYDDLGVVKKNNNGGGPKLQIVQADVVPPEELPGYKAEDTEDEEVWSEAAESAAKFYGTKVKEYDNRELLPDVNEALEDAIKDCTTVISCIGSKRMTNLWTDILARPLWRLLQPDVSRWCQDGTHPYYVNYVSTRKALMFAEKEQLRRIAAAEALMEERAADDDDNHEKNKEIQVPRIRFIRVSDLNVGQKPWHLEVVVANCVRSLIFRYQEMTEQLLDRSPLIDTVVLRPGDLVDEERDTNTTALQVCHTGKVPYPARVGRDDVAALAVAAAMFSTRSNNNQNEKEQLSEGPFHYKLACRWVGQEMEPYPAQGRKSDGLADAPAALQRALKNIRKSEKRTKRRQEIVKRKHLLSPSLQTSEVMTRVVDAKLARQRRRSQPHGICTAIPMYFMLGILTRAVLNPLLHVIPGDKLITIPAVARFQELFVMAMSFLVAQLKAAIPTLARRRQYISF